MNVPPSKPAPGAGDPLVSSNLSGIKTSINPVKYQCLLDTFEPAQKCRIKAVPFKGLFHQIAELKAACWLYIGRTANYFFISIS